MSDPVACDSAVSDSLMPDVHLQWEILRLSRQAMKNIMHSRTEFVSTLAYYKRLVL